MLDDEMLMLDWWQWVLLVGSSCLVVLIIVLCYVMKRYRAAKSENAAWRNLAKERADRINTLSHEIRTPLALISSSVEVMEDEIIGEINHEQRELLETIALEANAVETLANDLLVEAKLEADVWKLRFSTVDIGRLVRRTVADLQELHGRPITIHCPNRPMLIQGDKNLLRQVIINLINNSFKHAGLTAQLTVDVHPFDDTVLISITDNGTGISDSSKRQLLAQQFEGKSESGYGIGLNISRRIVKLHGGHCLIDSVVSKGTTILVSLPKGER